MTNPPAPAAPQTGREAELIAKLIYDAFWRSMPAGPTGADILDEYTATLRADLAESRKLCGTLSELHGKGEADNERLRAALHDQQVCAGTYVRPRMAALKVDMECKPLPVPTSDPSAPAPDPLAHSEIGLIKIMRHTPGKGFAIGEEECVALLRQYVAQLQNAEIAELKLEVDYQAKLLRLNAEDWADDDTRIKELAKPFGIDTEGDSYHVPGMVEVVEKMAEQLTQVKADNARLRAALEIGLTELINELMKHEVYTSDSAYIMATKLKVAGPPAPAASGGNTP